MKKTPLDIWNRYWESVEKVAHSFPDLSEQEADLLWRLVRNPEQEMRDFPWMKERFLETLYRKKASTIGLMHALLEIEEKGKILDPIGETLAFGLEWLTWGDLSSAQKQLIEFRKSDEPSLLRPGLNSKEELAILARLKYVTYSDDPPSARTRVSLPAERLTNKQVQLLVERFTGEKVELDAVAKRRQRWGLTRKKRTI